MGYSVYVRNNDGIGDDIWNPSLTIGNYFYASLQMLEKTVECESGIVLEMADSLAINSPQLGIFVETLMNYIGKTPNTTLFALISGTVEVVLALNFKVNEFYPESTSLNHFLIKRSKRVFYPINDYLS